MNMSLVTNLAALLVITAGYFSPWYSDVIMSTGFFALSGAITNWLAIHMLFEKVPLLYGSGVVPNHFEDFKRGIRQLIMNQFFTEENLNRFLSGTLGSTGAANIDMDAALDQIDYDKAFASLTEMILSSQFGGMLGMFGGPKLLEGFRSPFEERLRVMIKEQTENENFMNALMGSVDEKAMIHSIKEKVDRIVEARLDELTPQIVKKIVQDMIAKHLGWLVIWGGVFGGLIGLVMGVIKLL